MRDQLTENASNIFFRCVEDCNDSIMITDPEGRILYVNPAWLRTYEYSSEEVLGKTPRIVHSGRHPADFYENMWASISDPKVGYWKGEVTNRCRSGRLLEILLMITPFFGSDARLIGYLGIGTDISDQKRLAQKSQMQQNLLVISQFAEGLAHEIGTTLGVIRGRAEIIQAVDGPPSNHRHSEIILSQVDRISKMLSYLLQLCRGSVELRVEEIELRRELNCVIEPMKERMLRNSVELRYLFPPEMTVRSDRIRFGYIFGCLIENALDAIEALPADSTEARRIIRIGAQLIDGEVLLSVCDTGCGISQVDLDRIFQPFFTTKDVGAGIGVGLGLSFASRFVDELGGEISVKSSPGNTVFSVRLGRI